MILIIGGACQGKQNFLRKNFPNQAEETIVDGESASWEEFLSASCVKNLHRMVWRRFKEGESWEKLENNMAEEIFSFCPDRIVLTNEIGCGIVPVEACMRAYRETTGRICCKLASYSREVWRVTAGIGQRIA